MRPLLILLLVLVPVIAIAKPTIAVAPLEGDSENKIADVVAEVIAEDADVIGPEKTEKAMEKLGLSSELDRKDLTKLRAKLDADAVVSGKLEKEGKTKTLELGVTAKGRKTQKFTLTFKSSESENFRTELREELLKRIGGDEAQSEDEDDERKKREAEEAAKAEEQRIAEENDNSNRKKKKKKKKRGGDDDDSDDPGTRHPVTQAAMRVNAGVSYGRRSLTYSATGMNAPPPVGTAAPAGRIEGEVYPASFSSIKGVAAGIGLFGSFERAFGVKINVPQQRNDAAIEQGQSTIGARYRLTFKTSSVAIGVAYARRKYIADRSQLTAPETLDAPDVNYSAIAPGVIARIGATPKIGVFLGAAALLMLSTGQIQSGTSYGAADVIAFELATGVDVALARNYGLRFAVDFNNIAFKFKAKPGTMAAARGVSAATDRTISVALAFAVTY